MAEETKPAPAPAPAPRPAGPPPPKNPGFVTCSIDGREVVVKPGTNVIEAARTVGVDVPYYCYHKRLSRRGQLPHVPGGDVQRPRRKAHAGLPDAGGRGHHRHAPTARG